MADADNIGKRILDAMKAIVSGRSRSVSASGFYFVNLTGVEFHRLSNRAFQQN